MFPANFKSSAKEGGGARFFLALLAALFEDLDPDEPLDVDDDETVFYDFSSFDDEEEESGLPFFY